MPPFFPDTPKLRLLGTLLKILCIIGSYLQTAALSLLAILASTLSKRKGYCFENTSGFQRDHFLGEFDQCFANISAAAQPAIESDLDAKILDCLKAVRGASASPHSCGDLIS